MAAFARSGSRAAIASRTARCSADAGRQEFAVLEIARQALEIRIHALVEHFADEAHQNGVSENARHASYGTRGRARSSTWSGDRMSSMRRSTSSRRLDIGRPDMEGGFGGDRPFDEFARPQQFERTFIRLWRRYRRRVAVR